MVSVAEPFNEPINFPVINLLCSPFSFFDKSLKTVFSKFGASDVVVMVI